MITYRQAVTEDIPELVRLRKAQLADEGQDITSMDLDAQMSAYFAEEMAGDSFVEILACDGDEIVATGAVIFFRFPPSYGTPAGRRAYIANMYTADAYRGRGIATEILTRLHDLALSRGVDKFFLIASTLGKSVYERFGFREDPSMLSLS